MSPTLVFPEGLLVRFFVPTNTYPNVTRLLSPYSENRPPAETIMGVNASRFIHSLGDLRLACSQVTQRVNPTGPAVDLEDVVTLCFRRGFFQPLAPAALYIIDAFNHMTFREAVVLNPSEHGLIFTLEFRRQADGLPTRPIIVTADGQIVIDPTPEVA